MSLQLMANLVTRGSPAVVPITVDQYERMMELGILTEGTPIELLDGMLLYKDRRDGPDTLMTQGPRHLLAIKILARLLESLLSADIFHVQQQGPVICNEQNAPEPDICILKGTPDDFASELPRATDVLLAIEVSQTSLSLDQHEKAELYGRSGIPAYWIVNLVEDTVIVHDELLASIQGYRRRSVFPRGTTVSFELPGIDVIEIPVDDLLPEQSAL